MFCLNISKSNRKEDASNAKTPDTGQTNALMIKRRDTKKYQKKR
jgi:hypothetical protein